jgi:hypothetical protein
MAQAALALAARGLHVFPCHVRGKLPATLHGCKDASTDPIKVESWWLRDANYNVAVATGEASGVFVVDIDGPEAEAELGKLEAKHGALPATVEVITTRGRHLYFNMPPADIRNSASKIAAGVDVRANGGYVLAPPSIHPSGRRYCWSVDAANTIADPAGWLLTKILSPPAKDRATPPSEWRGIVNGVSEGCRDNTVTRLAGHLMRRRIDPHVTLELLRCWNASRCTPPLQEHDIERIVDSVAGLELKRRRG